ncbi:MAG: MarR family transcriptional regulator [Theionarchaea archaeon]|nr:MarR family transcriptional regulator [Theionarchaea archaeon]
MAEKQSREQKSLGRFISCIYRYTQMYIGKELEKYRIGSGQFSFLMTLYRRDGITQEDLANLLHVDKATSARAVKNLEKEGYIARKEDAEDKRKYRVFVTEKGREIESMMKSISSEWTARLLSGFTEDEKESVTIFLEKMVKNISEEVIT